MIIRLLELLIFSSFLFYTFIVLAFLWLLGNFFTLIIQESFIFRPKKLSTQYQYNFGEPYEELFIKSKQNGKINALWFKVDDKVSDKGIILFFHGNAGNLERWGHLFHYYKSYGYDFFLYDYRGFGKSSGKPSESLLYEDAKNVYKRIIEHYPADKIILYGRSLGCAFALQLASVVPVQRLILETPFSGIRNLFHAYYPFLPPVFFFKYRFPNYLHLNNTDVPVLIFQGTADKIVPYACAAKLKPYLKTNDEFITIEGGGHSNLMFYDIYRQKLEKWLE